MQPYFPHWIPLLDTDKSKWPKRSRQNLFCVPSRPPPFHLNALWIENHTRDIWTNNECPTDESQMEVFPGLFRRYCHIFLNARLTYRPRLTNVDAVMRRWCDSKREEMPSFLQIALISRSCHSTCASQRFGTNQLRYTQAPRPSLSRRTSIIFECLKSLSPPLAEVVRVPALMNKMLCKVQPHTFCGLTDNEATGFETLNTKQVNPLCWLPNSQGAYILDKDACNSLIGWVLQQKKPDGTDWPIR